MTVRHLQVFPRGKSPKGTAHIGSSRIANNIHDTLTEFGSGFILSHIRALNW